MSATQSDATAGTGPNPPPETIASCSLFDMIIPLGPRIRSAPQTCVSLQQSGKNIGRVHHTRRVECPLQPAEHRQFDWRFVSEKRRLVAAAKSWITGVTRPPSAIGRLRRSPRSCLLLLPGADDAEASRRSAAGTARRQNGKTSCATSTLEPIIAALIGWCERTRRLRSRAYSGALTSRYRHALAEPAARSEVRAQTRAETPRSSKAWCHTKRCSTGVRDRCILRSLRRRSGRHHVRPNSQARPRPESADDVQTPQRH